MSKKGLEVTVKCTEIEQVIKAYRIANNAIYFNDRSEYLNALYNICETILPNINRCEIGKRYLDETN